MAILATAWLLVLLVQWNTRSVAGVDAEKVGTDAANELARNIDAGGCVDEFLQDQVIDARDLFVRPFIPLTPTVAV